MIVAYLILEDGYPTMFHSRFLDEEECKKEVDRLNNIVRKHNEEIKRITQDPNYKRARGDSFLYMENKHVYTYVKREFPK